MTVSSSHSGGMQPLSTRYLTCSGEPVNERSISYRHLSLPAVTAGGGVGDGPGGFFACFEVCTAQYFDQDRKYVRVDDGLYLLSIAGGDVRNCPARFLADRFLHNITQELSQSNYCERRNGVIGIS